MNRRRDLIKWSPGDSRLSQYALQHGCDDRTRFPRYERTRQRCSDRILILDHGSVAVCDRPSAVFSGALDLQTLGLVSTGCGSLLLLCNQISHAQDQHVQEQRAQDQRESDQHAQARHGGLFTLLPDRLTPPVPRNI